MTLKDLEIKLNDFVKEQKLNVLEGQDEQMYLVDKVLGEVFRLLKDYNIYSNIVSNRNHIVITQFFTYPVLNAIVDIVIRFKQGTGYSKWDYKQHYYIKSIEVVSKDEDISTIEDVVEKINDSKIKRQLQKEKEIQSVKDFMKSHNLTYKETEEFVELFKKHQYSIMH